MNVFDRLHVEGTYRHLVKHSKPDNEQQDLKELRQCTFTPRINYYPPRANDYHGRDREALFDKLASPDMRRAHRIRHEQLLKEVKEMEECTFKPLVLSRSSFEGSRSRGEDAFEALFKDSAERDHKRRAKYLASRDRELDECVFTQRTNASEGDPQPLRSLREQREYVERLHQVPERALTDSSLRTTKSDSGASRKKRRRRKSRSSLSAASSLRCPRAVGRAQRSESKRARRMKAPRPCTKGSTSNVLRRFALLLFL